MAFRKKLKVALARNTMNEKSWHLAVYEIIYA